MIAIRIAAAMAVAASACTELGDVTRDLCGNGVIEAGNAEDCDGSEGCGLPDTALACRLLCDPDAAAPTCPGQAACGRDGSCHAPGGSFEVATSFTWTAPHLLIADTSADGYPELIGVANQQVEVRLGGPDLGFSPLPPIPSPALSGIPQVADFEGDGDADVTLPVGAGVFSLSGHPSTVLDPFFYNSFPAPAEGRIVGAGVRFADLISVPLIAAHDPGLDQSLVLFIGDMPGGAAAFPTGRTVDELVGDTLPVGTVIDGSATERTVALGFATGRTIALYDARVVNLDTLTVTARPAPVTLPPATNVKHGVWFADFDGDGHIDLVASVDQGGVEGLAVAWGRGDGVLHDAGNVANQATVVWRADRDQGGDGLPDGGLAPVQIGQITDNLLILGDENAADVIAAGGLYTTNCPSHNQCGLHLLRPSTRAWAGAAIVDINADERPDVIAFAEDQTGLDILLNTTTTLLFNDATVATGGVVERLISGDFNGDTIVDLAYVDATAGVPYTDALSVTFGQLLSPPSPPVYMGSIGEIVAAGELLAAGAGGFDFVSDLVLVTDREVDGERRRGAAIAFGSTARRLFAPLLPADLVLPMRDVISSRVDEAFPIDGNGDGFADLALLTTTAYSAGTGGGSDTAPLTVRHARFYAGQSDGQAADQGAVAFDLADLKVDRARWLGADVTATATDEAVGLLDDGSLLVVRLDGGCTGAACLTRVPAPTPAVADPVSFTAVDADGDGDTDLLGVMRNRDGRLTRDASVLVWWNQDGFSGDRVQRFDGDLADAAVVDRERDGVPELVVLFRDRAGSGEEAKGLRVATHTAGGFSELVPLAAALDGVALRAADVDGDGLDDLVVLAGIEREAPRELTVYLQAEARIPAGEE